MRKLIIVAPNDRYNYGDLIFSYIIKEKLKNIYSDFINVATVKNDLTKFGGDIVKPISAIYNLHDNENYDIIIAGGESLCSDWSVCVSYLKPEFAVFNRILKALGLLFDASKVSNMQNKIGRFFFNGKTKYPYTIGKNEIANIRHIYYNSLGGSNLTEKDITTCSQRILGEVDYISVRDENSYDLLNRLNIKVNLCPDSAILMSDIFTFDVLESKITTSVYEYIKRYCGNYIVFQINKNIGMTHIDEICALLKSIIATCNLNICLCPVGFALGHDDPVALSAIYKKMNNDMIELMTDISIWDIMSLISSSRLFIGSSLHGVVTAMSYSIPYIGLKVPKTLKYIRTWGIRSEITCSEKIDIKHNIDNVFKINTGELQKNSIEQKAMVNKSFEKIKAFV
ncbi:polysaccharide pyruvyl transferase family protein [Bacteroides stercorirosoris]|jgi:hypothetical protein|uniref:polysaccharide pyruvyl transferase family protein n=1 Tax=Bacteroides stercorirosoris TaxID=871324 RepID=UPI003520FC08